MIQLSAQQQAGIQKIQDWYDDNAKWTGSQMGQGSGIFRLFGPAGTGKTTMAKAIPEALGLHNVFYGTFTGKAAHVLRSKGAGPVSTIHSAIYMPTTSLEARAALSEARQELAEEQARLSRSIASECPDTGAAEVRITELEEALPELEANARRVSFEWNPESPWAGADLIMLDEVSMVNNKLAMDIEAFGVPIIVLGDPAQLPPVDGGGYYTNATPDFLLTEIHRSALDNPITALATRVRTSTGPNLGLTSDDMESASLARAMQHDQVLCWSNKMRWSMIKAIRNRLGRPEFEVVAGDRIMCLTNNRDIGVFNGEQFEVLEMFSGTLGPTLRVRTEAGAEKEIPVFQDGFMGRELQDQAKQSGSGGKGGRMLATFANAVTVHKAQGSEWGSVYVVNEVVKLMSSTKRKKGLDEAITEGRRWMYTACTRARQSVTITAPRA